MTTFTVKLFSPLPEKKPLADFVVADRRASLSFETQYPGGFSNMVLELPPDPEPPTPPTIPLESAELRPMSHVEVYANGGPLVWEGQVILPARAPSTLFATAASQMPGDLSYSGFTAHGYHLEALEDNSLISSSGTSYTPGGIIAEVIGSLTSGTIALGTGAQLIDPGTANQRVLSDFNGQFLSAILDELSKQGDGQGTVWYSAVWEGPTLWWLPNTPPTVPHYHPPAWMVSRWDPDASLLASGVYVTYTPPGGSTQEMTSLIAYDEAAFLATYKRPRTRKLDGGKMPLAAAEAFGLAYVTIHSAPEDAIELRWQLGTQGGDIDLMPEMPLFNGASIPLYLVRAGKWCHMGDRDDLLITRTTFDTYQGSWTATIGTGAVDAADQWRDHVRTVSALRGQRNPLTSAPWA